MKVAGRACGEGTYGYAADVGMPDLGRELHNGRFEGVVVGNLDVDLKGSSLVRRVGRAGEDALQVGEVRLIDEVCHDTRVVPVGLNILQLLGDSAFPGGGHDCGYCMVVGARTRS